MKPILFDMDTETPLFYNVHTHKIYFCSPLHLFFVKNSALKLVSYIKHICVGPVTQSRLTLCNPMNFLAHQALLSMNFSDKNPGAGCHFLFQLIFTTQGSKPHLLHCLHWRVDSLPPHHLRSPSIQMGFVFLSSQPPYVSLLNHLLHWQLKKLLIYM